MKTTLFACGPAANESELLAFEHLRSRLQSTPGDDEWVLLTNLAFSVNNQLQSAEIDIVAIGPQGARVVEIKHWSPQWVESQPDLVAQEADRVTGKARKIGTTLRKVVTNVPRVDGVVLLTREAAKVRRLAGKEVRGVRFYTLNDWKEALGLGLPSMLRSQQVRLLSRALEPKSGIAVDGSLRRFAGYVNLELQSPKENRFHRVYRGSHSARQDRVMLHLYDLSASSEKNVETKARREYEALHRLQLHAWAPRILDSYQEAPGYAGEMSFFTLVDPAAPGIDKRTSDSSWDTPSRLTFARSAVKALQELHDAGSDEEPMVHRNLTPQTLLVKHDNSPILTGFERSRIPSGITVASASALSTGWEEMTAPEVRTQGLAAADQRSDVYSLCACLGTVFSERTDGSSIRASHLLSAGIAEEPAERCKLDALETSLSELLGESVPAPAPPPARFWTEDQMVRFRDRDYRIVTRLGSGGVGATYKVIEIDRSTKEELGTYVAKVGHGSDAGNRVLKAYSLARSHLARHAALSAIFEVAQEWQENGFISLMTWVEGSPLGAFTGVFPLLAEEQQEPSSEALALRWLTVMCEALDVLHRNGLVHGDVSPRNMIVSGGDLVLTDYDFAARIGDPIFAPGTVPYCSPSFRDKRPAAPSDDFFALAASFFQVVFEKEPFQYGGVLSKERGLNWEGVDRDNHPALVTFMDRATHRDPTQRFESAGAALAALRADVRGTESSGARQAGAVEEPEGDSVAAAVQPILREERVDWLLSLLQSYPGSRWGNRETRGLDSDFSAQTYVRTGLEETLSQDIRERRARLVVLCGNAGDGKTALLQHLANELGLGRHSSSERVLEGSVEDGPLVRMNLDGSAAWQGRSADELLDDFLGPFLQGPPDEDIVHLLAINDGRLLEWIAGVESRRGADTPLTSVLGDFLEDEGVIAESYVRFISLNERSLVGGVTAGGDRITAGFIERLIDQLYGGGEAPALWQPCQSCSAKERCEVLRAARVFGPDGLPDMAPQEVRTRARERLFEALQAAHLRGETHITVRELRAALVYVLFGVNNCLDYHADTSSAALAYWDRAFAPDSSGRQGELLRELARFDPALEAHPPIDRHLLSQGSPDSLKTAPRYEELSLESARRRAFFEWTHEHVEQIATDAQALGLARGRHLQLFRRLALQEGSEEQAKLVEKLCAGISRLEDLPPQALDRVNVVPLRVTARTPTETAFWVEKPLSNFRIEARLPSYAEGIDRLHREAFLTYRYRDHGEESLRLGYELFHLLLELGQGFQLGDVSTDDTFAHLSIFVQRLVREDERKLLAWNPVRDETVYEIAAVLEKSESRPVQRMVLRQLEDERS